MLLGSGGLVVELALLEHYASFWQSFPLAVLVLGLGAALAVVFRPGRAAVLTFRGLMTALVMTGVLGVWLHYDENATFERELSPDARGFDLVWLAMRGATPLLAPGAFVQLGLLGLILAHDHPALRRGVTNIEEEER